MFALILDENVQSLCAANTGPVWGGGGGLREGGRVGVAEEREKPTKGNENLDQRI